MDNVAITHTCGHTGYTSPRITKNERRHLTGQSCPSCTTSWASGRLAQDLARAGCIQCGPRQPLRLLWLFTATPPTALALAGAQTKTSAGDEAWAACTSCHRWSKGR